MAVFRGNRKGGRKAAVRRRNVPRRPVGKARGLFKKKVLSVIRAETEDKTAYKTAENTFNSGINSVSEIYSILPPMGQGTDNGQRIGNKVKGKYLLVKGHLQMRLNTTDDASCRIGVRLLIMSPKLASYNQVTVPSIAYTQMIDAGAAANSFAGLVEDLYLPINRDVWTVHYDRVHYMHIDQITPSPTAVVTRGVGATIKFFTCRIKCNRILNYSDNQAYPSNFNPTICCGYAHLDGSTPDTVDTQVYMKYLAKMVYEDS